MYTLINLSAAELISCLFEKLGPLLERPLKQVSERGKDKLRVLITRHVLSTIAKSDHPN